MAKAKSECCNNDLIKRFYCKCCKKKQNLHRVLTGTLKKRITKKRLDKILKDIQVKGDDGTMFVEVEELKNKL